MSKRLGGNVGCCCAIVKEGALVNHIGRGQRSTEVQFVSLALQSALTDHLNPLYISCPLPPKPAGFGE